MTGVSVSVGRLGLGLRLIHEPARQLRQMNALAERRLDTQQRVTHRLQITRARKLAHNLVNFGVAR